MTKKEQIILDLTDAYLKFKSYVYHENFSIGLKKELSTFELGLDRSIKKLAQEVERLMIGDESQFVSRMIRDISYFILPKKFNAIEYDLSGGSYYTNKNKFSKYEIDDVKKLIPFINCSIELHVLTTLWVTKIGVLYDKNLSKSCYANRLHDLSKQTRENRLKLFKRYYYNYNNWRDNAIKRARDIHSAGDNVAILNLDIQSYYHSMDLDLSKLRVSKKYKWLNQVLITIHKKYVEILTRDQIISKPTKRIIPIGLTSSNILANAYLRDLDLKIDQKVRPAFYGRYVDDFLIVFRNPIIKSSSKKVVHDFIVNNLIQKTKQIEGTYFQESSHNSFSIVVNNNHLNFQLSKVKLYYFDAEDNIDLLEEFQKEIQKNSSEFKLQLEEEELKNPFEESIYRINYSDTINKLRSVDSFSHNKFGASKQIAKIIGTSKYLNEKGTSNITRISNKINEYFIGQRCLELYSLWEKTFSYFVITEDAEGLVRFSKQVLRAISKVKIKIPNLDDNQTTSIRTGLVNGLTTHLINSYAAAAALNINFFTVAILEKIKRTNADGTTEQLRPLNLTKLKEDALNIIEANLLRHTFCFYPLLNYSTQPKNFSFTSSSLSPSTIFEPSSKKIKFSPRYINYYEVEVFNFLKFRVFQKDNANAYTTNQELFNRRQHLLFNSLPKNRALTFSHFKTRKDPGFKKVTLDNHLNLESIKIGLANFKIDIENDVAALKRKPILSLERLNEFNKVLNEAVINNVDMVVFPEISVPFQWLGKLSEYSKRNNLAIICGLEHIVYGKEAFNYVCTILPFKDDQYTNAHIDLRLKIDYSPKEVLTLEKDFGLSEPKTAKSEQLRLYKWRGIFFSVLNCFELTDIQRRALFRGNVDIIFAVEYNLDTNYFSNINESFARDIHAYAIQVNTSEFGDTRITFPSEAVKRDYIKIKGGENVSLLVGYLDIQKLREFQRLPYSEQLKSGMLFKAIPPSFEMLPGRRKVTK